MTVSSQLPDNRGNVLRMGSSSCGQIVLLTLVSVGGQVFAAPSDKLCQPPQIGEELQICDTVHRTK